MNTELCFGQRIDPKLGILEPWYTNDAVDRIRSFDLSDKVVMEWGGGASTLWWARMAKEVYSVDHNVEWWENTKQMIAEYRLQDKAQIRYIPTHEGDQSDFRDSYIRQYPNIKPNICIVDGVHRFECAEYAVKVLKPKLLIIDNHQQDFVFMCPSLDVLLEGVKMERFVQKDHKDHEGNPWSTALFYL